MQSLLKQNTGTPTSSARDADTLPAHLSGAPVSGSLATLFSPLYNALFSPLYNAFMRLLLLSLWSCVILSFVQCVYALTLPLVMRYPFLCMMRLCVYALLHFCHFLLRRRVSLAACIYSLAFPYTHFFCVSNTSLFLCTPLRLNLRIEFSSYRNGCYTLKRLVKISGAER